MLSPATEFQSALPLRGATGAYTGNFRNAMEFQSALPLRGATRDCRTALIGPGRISIRAPLAGSDGRPDGRPGFYVISIRAPLAGSDTRAYSLRYTHRHFNPRSPCGERLRPNCRWSWNLYFNPRSPCGERPRGPARDRRRHISIRAPLAGSDDPGRRAAALPHISIRAPLAGSDQGDSGPRQEVRDFNPRSPCGERQQNALQYGPPQDFNPRSPCGERRVAWGAGSAPCPFQSALPLRGATLAGPPASVQGGNFNPRSPCGERHSTLMVLDEFIKISIRAPLAGSDIDNVLITAILRIFQSALPLRGATRTRCRTRRRGCISIRAPLAGSDNSTLAQSTAPKFQSALPLRGAT